MGERKTPWMKFFPADWRSDAGLRLCSFAARGLWLDMLSLMHEAEPYGHLVVGGIVPSSADLAALLGGTEREVRALLCMLEERRVFSRTADGTIYSRRMVRDAEQGERDKLNGRKGGNPRLKGEDNAPDNHPLNPDPRGGLTGGDKAHKLEARSQKEEAAASASADPPLPPSSPADVRPMMPRVGDPPQRWMHLADKREVDRDGVTRPVVGGYYLDLVAEEVCAAARINAVGWRGDWRPLMAWLSDGIEVPDIVASVQRVAARPGYQPPGSLRYFDSAVRERQPSHAGAMAQ